MKSKFDLLEHYFQNIIETSADFLWPDERIDLVRKLIHAIEAEMDLESDNNDSLPASFIIHLSPRKYMRWHADIDLLDRFAIALQEATVEVGLRMTSRPIISLEMMPDLADEDIQVHIVQPEHIPNKTALFSSDNPDEAEKKTDTENKAFLILEDGSHFPLTKSVINIGRREENEVVIDDLHISREHAQIRLIQNSYFLFDLNSTGGTYVNGRKIERCSLQPGDVISLYNHPIIYVQDNRGAPDAPELPDKITHTTRINTGQKEE